MLKDCARKCSHCGHNGHNSRTCSKFCTGFKLFGVHIDVACDGDGGGGDESGGMRKSKSMGNLQTIRGVSNGVEASGYLSDGFLNQSSKKKKGKPWSEEEHRSFLAGLEALGKGDWKGIARNFVPSRNSSQVASHAQKYFIRMAAAEKKRRRRSSVFDIPLNEVAHVTTSERPPLSPKSRHDNLNSRNKTYIPNLSSFTQGFQAKRTRPSVSWAPHVNFYTQSSIFSPDNDVVRMNVANATYMSQPSVVTFRQALRQGSSQPNH